MREFLEIPYTRVHQRKLFGRLAFGTMVFGYMGNG